MEEWRDIKGFEGVYQVSNKGRFKRLSGYDSNNHYIHEHYMKVTPEKRYPSIHLSMNGKAVKRSVHRILAETFIPNPENKPHINHIDEDKQNYDLSNLEWVTQSENMRHGTAAARRTLHTDYEARNTPRRPVLQYTKDWVFVRRWRSASEASRVLEMPVSSLQRAAKGREQGKSFTSHGYIWKYETEKET